MESNLVQNLVNLKSLPQTWIIKDFKEVVSDNSGGNKKLAKSNFLKKGDIAVVDQGKKLIAGYYNDTNLVVKTQPPYVVFGDHTRAFKYIDFPFVMGADGTKVLQPKNSNCDTKFLYYFFLSINVPDTGYNRHFKYLKELKIPLPPLGQQKKIAAILDAADGYRQKTKALITKYEELTQSLFLDMFGDETGSLTELGKIIKTVGGGTPSKDNEQYWNGNIPWASVKDLKSDRLNKTQDFITQAGVDNSATRVIPNGSLIVATRMAVGRAAICEMDVAINQDLKAIQLIGEINIMYLLYLFKSKENYFDSVSSGATVKGIKIEHITKLKVNLPEIDLQNQFAERIQAIDAQKAQAQASLAGAEDLFNSLLQRAFKGELV